MEKQGALVEEFDEGLWSSLVQEVVVKSKDDSNQIFLKSQKAFKQIEWKDAWQVYKDESDVKADFHARREVNQFLSARNRAILLEGFEVPGITVRTAMGKFLLYHQEGDFYE